MSSVHLSVHPVWTSSPGRSNYKFGGSTLPRACNYHPHFGAESSHMPVEFSVHAVSLHCRGRLPVQCTVALRAAKEIADCLRYDW